MWDGCKTRRSNNKNRNFSLSNNNSNSERKHVAGEHNEFSVSYTVCSTYSKRVGNFFGQDRQFGFELIMYFLLIILLLPIQ
jgi:hypothetical protein